ncbi:hypothetical protein LA080_008756 [Diaporthe eres]|nr:hypothetical protein LA080_008756 [Diaporthe eres]
MSLASSKKEIEWIFSSAVMRLFPDLSPSESGSLISGPLPSLKSIRVVHAVFQDNQQIRIVAAMDAGWMTIVATEGYFQASKKSIGDKPEQPSKFSIQPGPMTTAPNSRQTTP